MAIGTLGLIVSVTADIDVGETAVLADNNLAPALLSNEITATLVAIEVVSEGDKGIKVLKCKFHSSRYFYLFIP